MPTKPIKTIDAYIATFPKEVQALLEKVRATIKKAAPKAAEETISYQIPTFKLDGRYLVYFAGYKKHISVYPAPVGDAALKDALAPYAAGKGTLQFPLAKPLPLGLITQVVKFRVQEHQAQAIKAKPGSKS